MAKLTNVDILDQLQDVLYERKANPSEKSYTAKLFAGGEVKICEKITEEAAEVVEAAFEKDESASQHLVNEVADLLFHSMVLLVHKDLGLDNVRSELARRFGMSGLEERASRKS